MKRRVWIERTREEREEDLPGDMTIRELLEKLGIPEEDVLVALDGTIKPEDETLGEAREIRILSVISGG